MNKNKIQKRVFKRSFIQLSLALVAVFLVLGISFVFIFRHLSRTQLESQLLKTGAAIGREYEKDLSFDYMQLNSSDAIRLVNFAARSTKSLVWLVNAKSEIIYSSAFPRSAELKLGRENGFPILPQDLVNRTGQGLAYGDRFAEYLNDAEEWLTISWPLESGLGGYAGEVLIHQLVAAEDLPGNYMLKSLLLSIGIAVAVSFLAIGLLARRLTMPISALAKTAEAVYLGDLSARVELAGWDHSFLSKKDLDQSRIRRDDDLTLLVKTMNSLIASLEEEESDRQDFLISISHDLRTPLTTVKGFVQGILDGTIPEDKQDYYLNLVKQETGRMQALVQSLFDASMSESKGKLELTVFDLNGLLNRNLKLLESQVREKELELEFEFFCAQEDGSMPVKGDPQLIHRVVANLLVNALRFTPKGGRIKISTCLARQADQIEIRVEDSGPGVDPEDRDLIFDRFYKVDKSRSGEGSGLGLFIVKSILARHGSMIHYFESDLGGAGFSFNLNQAKLD